MYQEFLENFDAGREKEGLVTRNEFINYHANISANIVNDDYFLLLVASTWRLVGLTTEYTPRGSRVGLVDKLRASVNSSGGQNYDLYIMHTSICLLCTSIYTIIHICFLWYINMCV